MNRADGAALRVLSARRRVEPVYPQIDDRLDTINKQELVANLVPAEGRQACTAVSRSSRLRNETW